MSSTVRNPKAVIAVAAFAAFLATFNETYLNVAFAPIMSSLGVKVATVQWLATAYMLGAAVMVPVSAFAYRSLPTRPLFCGTVAILVLGSIVGALAQGFPMLLIGRIIQALGTGMLIPIGMNITLEVAPKNKLGTYMGIMGSMTTLGPSLSVIVAGVLLSMFSWNMLLWVFAGLSFLCLLCGAILLGDIARLTHPRLDVVSVAFIGIALVGILYGVSTVFSGNLVMAGVPALVGIVFLVLFVKRQGKLEQPLINLEPLKVAPFTVGVVINMISLISIFAMNILVPTFMQSVLGVPSMMASLTLFPAIALCCVMSPIAGRLYDKHGAGTLLPVGFLCIGIFTILVAMFIASGNIMLLALVYIPVIVGSSLIIGPVQSFALSKLTWEQNPHGVTVMSTGFQIAGCIGSSLFTGVYAFVIGSEAASGAPIAEASASGFFAAGVLVAVFALVGFILALKVRGWEKKSAQPVAAEAAVEPELSLVEKLMKTDVYSLRDTDTVLVAVSLFVEKGISGVPVVDEENRVKGFISDGDVMRYLAKQVPAFKSPYSFVIEQGNQHFDEKIGAMMQLSISEICNDSIICVDAHDDMGSICKVLAEHHLKKAPVVKDGKMVGVINRSNINRYSMNNYLQSLESAGE